MNPKTNALQTNKIPLELDVPIIFLKFFPSIISGVIKVILSKIPYMLLSIEEKRFSRIVFIVVIIVFAMLSVVM